MEVKVELKVIEEILKNEKIVTDGMMVDEDELSDYCDEHLLDFYDIWNLLDVFGYDFF